MRPMIAIIAKRPLFLSEVCLRSSSSSSMPSNNSVPRPKSEGPRPPSRGFTSTSWAPTSANNCTQPSKGMDSKAPKPCLKASHPGKRKISGIIYPMVAIMATRPCLISTCVYLSILASVLLNSKGSNLSDKRQANTYHLSRHRRLGRPSVQSLHGNAQGWDCDGRTGHAQQVSVSSLTGNTGTSGWGTQGHGRRCGRGVDIRWRHKCHAATCREGQGGCRCCHTRHDSAADLCGRRERCSPLWAAASLGPENGPMVNVHKKYLLDFGAYWALYR